MLKASRSNVRHSMRLNRSTNHLAGHVAATGLRHSRAPPEGSLIRALDQAEVSCPFCPAPCGPRRRSAAVLKASRSNVRHPMRLNRSTNPLAGHAAATGLRHSRAPPKGPLIRALDQAEDCCPSCPAPCGTRRRSAAVLKASRSNVRHSTGLNRSTNHLAGHVAATGLRHSRAPPEGSLIRALDQAEVSCPFCPAPCGPRRRSAAVLKASRSNVRHSMRLNRSTNRLAGHAAATGLRHSRAPPARASP